MMRDTRKLFDEDARARAFSATVLSAAPAPGGVSLVLDQTLFFPEEGGQTPDRGVIDGFPVLDVQLEGGVVRHLVQIEGQSPFAPGQVVRGEIDFAHRFSNMQNHSGEHILSGLVHARFGYDNVGFHLSDKTVTLDFNGPLSEEDLSWLESEANRVVWENKEIRAWYPSPEELAGIRYRSKKEIDGPLRIVEIPGVDVCACCAPHVGRTGEIGLIKIIRVLREREGIRLTILCGGRALAYMQALQKAAEDVSHLTNMPREEIAAGASRLLDENERLRQRGSRLEALYARALAAAVPPGQAHVFLFVGKEEDAEAAEPPLGNLAQRNLVNALCAAHPGYCGVFVGRDPEGDGAAPEGAGGYKFIIGVGDADGKSGGDGKKACGARGGGCAGKDAAGWEGKKDARILSEGLRKACGARGGGKPAMVQGSVRAGENQIRAALAEIVAAAI